MLDRDRILTKIDELDGYIRELRQVVPAGFAEYLAKVEARRACERLLQISIQSLLDICHLFVAGLRLGLPAEEDDMLSKIEQAKVFSPEILQSLRTMKGFRNILVHEYGGVDNAIVFKAATARLRDFEACKIDMLRALQQHGHDPR